jgi:hypothetical protein
VVRFVAWCVVLAGCGFETAIPTPQLDGPQMVAIDASPDAPPMQACIARYGTADRFQLCNATPTSCRFYVHTNNSSCEALCTSLGGTCISSHDGDCQTAPSVRPCSNTFGDQVCTCAP